MKNKEVVLNKLEKIENTIKNLDYSVKTGDVKTYNVMLTNLKEKLEEVRSLISIEQSTY